jgi:hypothetical protein
MRVFTVRTEKLFVVLLALCLCAATAFAQESWQGNAAIARSGEFSTPGLFAASNAFPKNARILVQNPQTGQSVQVTVAQRIPGAGNIFLLLTEEAGTQIGLTGSEVIRVQANVLSSLGTGLGGSLQEGAYSADPDLNPPVSITDEQLLAGPGTPSEEQVRPEAPTEEEEVAAQASPAGEELEEEPIPEAEAPAASKEVEKTPEEKRLEELAGRIPQKHLYMPPRQQEIYALAPQPTEAEEVEEQIAAVEEPAEEVAVAAVEETAEEPPAEEVIEQAAEEEIQSEEPRVSMLVPLEEQEDLDVALPGPEAVEPEKPSPEGSRLPFPEEESPLTMEPEEPPFAEEEIEVAVEEEAAEESAAEAAEPLVEEEPVSEIAMAESPSRPQEQLILSEILPSSSYFVQIGAYSTRNLAEKLAGDLTQTYSVTILPASSGGRQFYKVLVGPLNVDESGTLLYQFRSRGFKDAFIQYVE